MSKPLKLKTYTSKELKMIIPALGTFIRPLLYNGRYVASCNHYSEDCYYCPLYTENDLCDSMYVYDDEDIEDRIELANKFFPHSFIENHPELFI